MTSLKIENIEVDQLKKGDWHCNHILRPDLLTLSASLNEFGFIFPILVRRKDNSIIDGYHRWMLVKENEHFAKKIKTIPCVFVDCDSLEAAMMHIRLNRGRGNLVAHKLAKIVRDLVYSNKYTEEDMDKLLSMKYDELHLLLDGTLIKKLNISEHKYSRAWVPIEAPAGTVDTFETERPPNRDR
jgi:ParB-like chromosome segregation protein Spo0J